MTTDARREAVARWWEQVAGRVCPHLSMPNAAPSLAVTAWAPDCPLCMTDAILAWHDAEVEGMVADRAMLWKQLTDAEIAAAHAETRALREALNIVHAWACNRNETFLRMACEQALLTPTPGAGKEEE